MSRQIKITISSILLIFLLVPFKTALAERGFPHGERMGTPAMHNRPTFQPGMAEHSQNFQNFHNEAPHEFSHSSTNYSHNVAPSPHYRQVHQPSAGMASNNYHHENMPRSFNHSQAMGNHHVSSPHDLTHHAAAGFNHPHPTMPGMFAHHPFLFEHFHEGFANGFGQHPYNHFVINNNFLEIIITTMISFL